MSLHDPDSVEARRAETLSKFSGTNWRGVNVGNPKDPTQTTKYHTRRLPLLQAAEEVDAVVARLGFDAALEHFNERLLPLFGMPFFFKETRYAPQFSRAVKRGTFYLPGGCHWAVKGGPCSFCIFQPAVDDIVGDLPLDAAEFTAIAKIAMALLADCEVICCFTAGSLLNPSEVPNASKLEIARMAAALPNLKTLLFESRVQFFDSEEVARATLAPVVEILAAVGRTCEVAIGVESMDEAERRELRKGMTTERLKRAIAWGGKVGARISAYLILMPLPMSDQEAVQRCVASTRKLLDLGVAEVLIQPRYGPEGTRCPTHWAIAETLYALRDVQDKVTLGYWAHEPGADVVPSNRCPNGNACDEAMIALEQAWREAPNPDLVAPSSLQGICTCYQSRAQHQGLAA